MARTVPVTMPHHAVPYVKVERSSGDWCLQREIEMDGERAPHQIVIAGAGYAGLHVALRLGARLERRHAAQLTLVDQHDFHQVLTELPRVAAGTRQADAVRVPLQQVLEQRVTFVQTRVTGFDLAAQRSEEHTSE